MLHVGLLADADITRSLDGGQGHDHVFDVLQVCVDFQAAVLSGTQWYNKY